MGQHTNRTRYVRSEGALHGNFGRFRLERLGILLSNLGELQLYASGREPLGTDPGSCLVDVIHRNRLPVLLECPNQLA